MLFEKNQPGSSPATGALAASPRPAALRVVPSEPLALLPTTLPVVELARVVCLATLGNSSAEAELVFKKALTVAKDFFVPAGSHVIRARSFDVLSGMDLKDRNIRIGRPEAIIDWLECRGVRLRPNAIRTLQLASRGQRDLVVADQRSDLGIVRLESR